MDEEVARDLVVEVINRGYSNDLTDVEIEEVGRDPFLIAYALSCPLGRFVITNEHSRPSRKRANRHVPDVCSDLALMCDDTFFLIRSLNFRTGWKTLL